MTRYLVSLTLAAALLISILAGCSNQSQEQRHAGAVKKLQVYTTIFPVYDFTVNIGGDKVEVQKLIPPGIEPHKWEPSPRDVVGLGSSDVFVYNGVGMEPWVEKFLNSVNKPELLVVDASNRVVLLAQVEGHKHGHGYGHSDSHNAASGGKVVESKDPHIWLDPLNAKIMVDNIKDALSKADPINNSYYETNANRYKEELELLHKEYLAALENAPNKAFITSHDAFGYLAHRYKLKQIPIRGVSPEVEPTPGKVAEIIKIVHNNKINYIFFESLVSPKVSEVIAKETGTEILPLNPLDGLSQVEIDAGKNYLSVMRDNLANLKIALGVKE